MGQLDADGYLSITGRIKELIIRGGEKIMPREVEDVLGRCPGVREAAVIGEPDGDRGEAVVAFVVPGDERRRRRRCANIAGRTWPSSRCRGA